MSTKIAAGLKAHMQAIGAMRRHPALWSLALAPFILQLVAFAAATAIAWHYLPAWVQGVWDFIFPALTPATTWYGKLAMGLLKLLVWLGKGIFALGLLTFTYLVCALLGMAIAAPLYDLLCEKSVRLLWAGTSDEPITGLLAPIWRSVLLEMQKTLIILTVAVAGFIFGLLPLVGAPLALLWLHAVAIFGFSYNFLDYPMSRQQLGLRQRLRFMRQHLWYAFGFGLAVYVPFVNLFGSPLFVVAATKLFGEIGATSTANQAARANRGQPD